MYFPTDPKKILPYLKESLLIVLLAILMVAGIRVFVAEPLRVTGSSMESFLSHDSYVIVDRLTYKLREPKRGELVAFHYPNNQEELFVKRIIGLPGEKVTLQGNVTEITTVTGETIVLEEPYVSSHNGSDFTMPLGPDDFFVLGDNRPKSSDSREWGPLERPYLVGRILFKH